MTDKQLVSKLIDAAYDSGYYSGKKEDGQPHHRAAIERRNRLKQLVLQRMNMLRGSKGGRVMSKTGLILDQKSREAL